MPNLLSLLIPARVATDLFALPEYQHDFNAINGALWTLDTQRPWIGPTPPPSPINDVSVWINDTVPTVPVWSYYHAGGWIVIASGAPLNAFVSIAGTAENAILTGNATTNSQIDARLIAWDTIGRDTLAAWNFATSHVFWVAPYTGWYSHQAKLTFPATAVGEQGLALAHYTGTLPPHEAGADPTPTYALLASETFPAKNPAAWSNTVRLADLLYHTAGDQIAVIGMQTSGGALQVLEADEDPNGCGWFVEFKGA